MDYKKSPEYKKGTSKLLRGLITTTILGGVFIALEVLIGAIWLTLHLVLGMAGSGTTASYNLLDNLEIIAAVSAGVFAFLIGLLGIAPTINGEKMRKKAKKTFNNEK
mgnify:CR=1 FL=1